MAKSTKASKAINKIKKQSKGAWDKSREKEAQVKGAKLPGGIIGGVAKLLDHKIDETDEKAVPYVTLTFLVLEPDEHNGKKERKTYYFQDTPEFDKTMDDVMDDFSSAYNRFSELTQNERSDQSGYIMDLVKQAQSPMLDQRARNTSTFWSSETPRALANTAGRIGRDVGFQTEQQRLQTLGGLSNTYLGLMGQQQANQYGAYGNALGAYGSLASTYQPHYAAPEQYYQPSGGEQFMQYGLPAITSLVGAGVGAAGMASGAGRMADVLKLVA